jgi:hypothetical protein
MEFLIGIVVFIFWSYVIYISVLCVGAVILSPFEMIGKRRSAPMPKTDYRKFNTQWKHGKIALITLGVGVWIIFVVCLWSR